MPSHLPPNIYAPIEDLDPEPSPGGGWLRRREVILGAALLLAVLGFAGWDWWHQEGQATAYRSGAQAAAGQQWDAAEAAFRAVGTYRDAPARASQAATNRAERDRHYRAAQAALAQADYLAALTELRAVDQVQPGYRDTMALREQAHAPLLRLVLSGTVALRPTAQPPGLYRVGAAGWAWLPGSDAASRVQGRGAPAYVLYDGPNPGLPRAAARVLIRADLGQDPAQTDIFTLDPASYSRYRVGADGVWGIRDRRLRAPALTDVRGYGNLDLTYQATDAPRSQTLILPGPAWLVLDLAPDGRHYLLADLSGATGDTPTSLLYYAGAARPPQALVAVPGLLLRAQFSPDGRWVLLTTTHSRATRTDAVQYVQLLDRAQPLLAPTALRTLLRQAVGAAQAPGLGATFLTAGPRAGQIVLLSRTAEGSQLSLVNPATPTAAPQVLWAGLIPLHAPLWLREGTGDGGLVFGWQETSDFGQDGAFVYVNGQDRGVTLRLQQPWQTLGTAWLVGDHLLYDTSGVPASSPVVLHSLYSLALTGVAGERPIQRHFGAALPAGGAIPKPTLFYNKGLPAITGEAVAFSPPWLAIVPSGTLHLRSMDGTVDESLAEGVTALFPVVAPFTAASVLTLTLP